MPVTEAFAGHGEICIAVDGYRAGNHVHARHFRLSCPALCRASTSLPVQDVDGRVKPGHDDVAVLSVITGLVPVIPIRDAVPS
jgi:hypothetical protein